MKLFVFPGDEFAASIDPECLQVLTYIRLVKAVDQPVLEIISTCQTWQSPTGFLPTLVVNDRLFVGSVRIINELRNQGLEIDSDGVSDQDSVDALSYSALLKDKLKLALLFVHWMDSKNYTEFTRQWFGKTVWFPMSQCLLSRQHRLIDQQLKTQLPEEINLEHRGLTLITEASNCLDTLSVKLGDKALFFAGARPSLLDAIVFGYLDVISQYPLPGNNKLMVHLNSLKKLSHYCDRMRNIAFPEIKSRCPTVANGSTLSGPLWRDPTVWACAFVGGALIAVQGARIGLFSRIIDNLR